MISSIQYFNGSFFNKIKYNQETFGGCQILDKKEEGKNDSR